MGTGSKDVDVCWVDFVYSRGVIYTPAHEHFSDKLSKTSKFQLALDPLKPLRRAIPAGGREFQDDKICFACCLGGELGGGEGGGRGGRES